MAASLPLPASAALDSSDSFNWVLLVEMLICGILTVFFLFYFNRLFATLVSYGIRAYTWHTYRAYIDIKALQVSLLGGRIFFSDLRYHAHNETIIVHSGHITWQYWQRRVRDADVYSDDTGHANRRTSETSSVPGTSTGTPTGSRGKNVDNAEKGGKQAQKRLPCRITIKVSGVEAFMYNRSPAYDGIVEAIRRKANATPNEDHTASNGQSGPVGDGSVTSSANIHENGHHHSKLRKQPDTDGNQPSQAGVDRVETAQSATPKTKPDPLPAFLRLLPINVECNKGAIVVGNEHTLSVITAQFEKATGEVDASKCGPLDVYRQVFNLQFTHPVVHIKPNSDFKSPQLELAARIRQESVQGPLDHSLDEKSDDPKRRRRFWFSNLSRLSGIFSKSTDSIHTHPRPNFGKRRKSHGGPIHFPGQEHWEGLTRYLDTSQDSGHGEWDNVEYGRSSLIVDCPRLDISFYWDITGPVPSELDNSQHVDPLRPRDINGSIPPEYGMDIKVHGGIINYGPWADRHRALFQSIFFPASRVDAVAASPLTAGHLRVLSVFKIYLSIEEDTVLRIPTREPSKDWKWKGKAQALPGREKNRTGTGKAKAKSRTLRRPKQRDTTAPGFTGRPFGWFDVKVAGNSSVNYIMDMVASQIGYQNKLDVDIASTEISSSVNHGLLWRSGPFGLDCDLSSPLSWNSLRKWKFNMSCRDLELFLLRDHLFLLTDLVADWGSGPPSEYFTFVPFQYLLNIDFVDFKLYLNTNDSNVVNNPSDLDDNNFIILYGQRLHGDVTIPLDRFRPQQNEISFDIRGEHLGLELCMPSRNTLNTFVRSKNLANLGSVGLTGSHTYMTETSSTNTDRLFMDLQGSRLTVELYGWLIHHFMKIKDNYFGDDLHFKTLEEFQGLPSQNFATDPTIPNGSHTKESNDLDVIICISVEETSAQLPSNLYSAEKSLYADIPYISADLRFTNYYMDLMVDFSPTSLSATSSGQPTSHSGYTEIFVESVVIYGHRLFGLPPNEPTYVCNWDFEVGKVSGDCSPNFIEKVAGAARSFAFTLDDPENALPITNALIIHDSTFLRLKTEDIHVWFHVASEAVLLSTGPINLSFNDLAGTTFSERLNVSIPDLTIGAVDAKSDSRYRTPTIEKHVVETHAFLHTSLSLDMLKRKADFTVERNKQQSHMQEQDQRTNRTPFMFIDHPPSSSHERGEHQSNIRAPAMQFPELPHPIFLYKPQGSQRNSSASSGYSSHIQSASGRLRSTPFRSASTGSLAHSIRSVHRRPQYSSSGKSSRSRTLMSRSRSRMQYAEQGGRAPSREESRSRSRNLPSMSVAFSSSLARPHFPFDHVQPDLSDVPLFPETYSHMDADNGDGAVFFNDVSSNNLDETYDHTTLIIHAEPGIRAQCTPTAVRCVSDLMALVLPNRPDDLLDDFHVGVMTKILDYQKRREGQGNSFEFGVRIPFVHVRFQNGFGPSTDTVAGKDQYDIILNRLKLATRIKKVPYDDACEDTVALHTMLGSLGVTVTERALQGRDDDLAIRAEIKDLFVWMLKSKETTAHIAFKTLETATASRKMAYLASLIHRTALLGSELATHFEDVGTRQQGRLRYLAWFITSVQERFPDPAFLTKASYTLRSARDHLRGHDSWKIISRFRYIWQNLPEDERAEVIAHCSQNTTRCPEGVKEKIITMWDKWRAWDLAHVKNSLAMKTLFGSQSEPGPQPVTAPLSLDIRSHSVKFIVDPGPHQSETALHILAINVTIVPPSLPTGLMLVVPDTPKRSTIVQFSANETSIKLRWEITELFEKLFSMFQKDQLKQRGRAQPQLKDAQPKKEEDHDLQVVFVSEKAEVSVDTINLRSNTTGQRLRLSVAGSDRRASGEGETMTVLLHLEQAVIELRSRSRPLVRAQFDHPSIYVAHHDYGADSETPNKIKVAAASRMIKLEIPEDILGFIEVVDIVVRDEIAYLYQQVTTFKQSVKQRTQQPGAEKVASQLPNITLALFMDAYIIEFALLQSLTWTIAGSSGRISAVPSVGQNVTISIDYDIAAHTHSMVTLSPKGTHVISSIKLPPGNGRLSITKTKTETKISASGIIETIQLQASEIQALVATFNKPEFPSVFQAIRDDVAILKSHIKETFPESEQSPIVKSSSASRDIVFDVGMTLSGLAILASAPGQVTSSSTANLAFKLASLQLKVTNLSHNKSRLALPEVVAHLGEISVEMTLSDSEATRQCGNLKFGATFQATSQKDPTGGRRVYRLRSSGLEVNLFADTASAVVDVMNHLQDKIKDLDLSKERKYLRRLRHSKSRISHQSRISHKRDKSDANSENESVGSDALFMSTYELELLKIQVSWIVGNSIAPYRRTETEDLVLSFRRIDLTTKKGDSARLMIEDLQLQMVPVSAQKDIRSPNSALLPEIVFHVTYISTKDTRNIAFQSAGKSLDLRLDSRFILPANVIERSIALAGKKVKAASTNWSMKPTTSGGQRTNPFGNKRLASLLVDANFAGAVVHINGSDVGQVSEKRESRSQQKGRYSQFVGEDSKSSMILKAPGIALKVEYKDDGNDPSLNAELRIDGSSNTLYPTVVPLLINISDTVKEVVREKDRGSPATDTESKPTPKPPVKLPEEDNLITADPSTILGRTRLNLGLRICKQEFSLSCQPIARVAAIAKVEDIYVTVNSLKSQEHGHFFAASAVFQKLEASVQHVYSRESTFAFDVDSVVLSLMNSKHLSGTSGISAILKINPMALQVNARQLQDFLLFREIWLPPEIRQSSKPATNVSQGPQEYLMQRYEQVTAATAFPWNANIAIADMAVELDLGQAIGKTSLQIHNLWASSKKSTDWEQNMCIGVEKVGLQSTGRTSGFLELTGVKVRTSISWPSQAQGLRQTPLVQASLGFTQLRVKAGFDYQAFMIADITNFHFLMYNVREQLTGGRDRLVAVLGGDKVHVCCTATSAAQGLALFQAVERLIQDNQQAYKQSLKDIEKFLRRKSSISMPSGRSASQGTITSKQAEDSSKTPIYLHTDVVVTLRSINLGVYPSTFVDTQIFSVEAEDVQARFAVALEQGKIHSALGMTLGKLSVALSSIPSPKKRKPVTDLTVEDVLESAKSARGGIILRVPKVIATMHTWQVPKSVEIDYIFQSNFEGKVDVGWNYSRISFIRTMWSNHSRTLALRLGKPLPDLNIKITSSSQQPPTAATPSSLLAIPGVKAPAFLSSLTTTPASSPANASPPPASSSTKDKDGETKDKDKENTPPSASAQHPQEKITAEIKVPQSKYHYNALEPPVIETPQLRDMGEATPPLEWIGLHRDRLPNVTHQIVIVTLLEVAREVEEAYTRILGTS